MRDNQRRMRCGNTPPPKEESSKMEDSMTLEIEALMKEAFENLKAQVDVEEELKMDSQNLR